MLCGKILIMLYQQVHGLCVSPWLWKFHLSFEAKLLKLIIKMSAKKCMQVSIVGTGHNKHYKNAITKEPLH